MRFGNWQLDSVNGGRIRLDGGIMFGVVPRVLWQRVVEPDAKNRVLCTNRCLLARDGRHTVLVDTGYGDKHSMLDRRFYDMEEGNPLLESLADLGVAPEQVDTVVFTHLHFDHVSGATRFDSQKRRVLTFPNARHIVSRWEWEDATGGAEELESAYPREDIHPLYDSGATYVVDDGQSIVPGVTGRVTGGHTRGHMCVRFESNGESAVFLGDICPTTAHMRQMWHLAYDVYPLDTRRNKPALLREAADRHWWVIWYHDARIAASRVARDHRREYVPVDCLETL